jgi:hypothetical protein
VQGNVIPAVRVRAGSLAEQPACNFGPFLEGFQICQVSQLNSWMRGALCTGAGSRAKPTPGAEDTYIRFKVVELAHKLADDTRCRASP